MKIEVHNKCSDFNSYRAARVKSLFNAESGCNFDLVADLPLESNAWQIGVVVGPSGSGKTSIGKAIWGGEGFYEKPWPSDSPPWRDAVKWTLKMRDAVTGGSVYWLDDRMDAGPIAAHQYCFVDPDETVESLWREKLFPMGVDLISSVVSDISGGRIVKEFQNERHATFEPACNPPPVRRPDLPRITWHPVELMGP